MSLDKNQEARFSEILSKVLKTAEGKKELAAHGLTPDDIGTHSIRKGSSTYTMSGSTSGPSIISVCQRAGWSYGDVLERYLRYEAAGDNYVGRVVCGLPADSPDFSLLPPHFNRTRVSVDDVKRYFPSINDLRLNEILSHCLASVLYHLDFLNKHLPKTAGFRSSLILSDSDNVERLTDAIIVGSRSEYMSATGIPPYILILMKLFGIEVRLEDFPEELAKIIEKILQDNGAAAANVTPELIFSTIDQGMKRAVDKHFPRVEGALNAAPAPNPTGIQNKFGLHMWGGKLHRLPSDYDLPTVSVPVAWRLWIHGNPRLGLPPFKMLDATDFQKKNQKKRFSDWKYLMRVLIDLLGDDFTCDINSEEEMLQMQLKLALERLNWPSKKYHNRPDDWTILTAVKETRKLMKTGAGDVSEDEDAMEIEDDS